MEDEVDGKVFALSDLHVECPENRQIIEELAPESTDDWLMVAGDTGEVISDIEWALKKLAQRFATVIWTPGNHELWTTPGDPVQLRGERRYRYLVEMCRDIGVLTPEDGYPVWCGPEERISICPLFTFYDYSFGVRGHQSKYEALQNAHMVGVVCTDEYLLHPDPFASREDWCRSRVRETFERLSREKTERATVLLNHYPLTHHPTKFLRYPEFAMWCGTESTRSWPRVFNACAVVFGHLHIPFRYWHNGVQYDEVSLGLPRNRRAMGSSDDVLRQILPSKNV
jgi:3',5'-cyclic AMP phosphodiesterase CpdA